VFVVVKSQVGFAAHAVAGDENARHLEHHPGRNLLHAHLVGSTRHRILLIQF
jgi:hypothetical protein